VICLACIVVLNHLDLRRCTKLLILMFIKILGSAICNLGLVRLRSFLPEMIPRKAGLYKLYKRSGQERRSGEPNMALVVRGESNLTLL
jgi:hypothetical protein